MKKYYAILMLVCTLGLSHSIADELIANEAYASYYGEAFNGKPTSSGEIFDMNLYTAAHKTLPFGTLLEVTNLENGKKVVVRVNDRGPFVANRELDLSKAAAESLGMMRNGIARVSIKKLGSLEDAASIAAQQKKNHNTYTTQKMFNETEKQRYVESQFNQQKPVLSEKPLTNNRDANPAAYASEPNRSYQPEEKAYRSPRPAYNPEPVYTPANTESSSGVLWRIQLGAFVREENALRLVVALRKIGLEPAYERANSTIRVVLPGIRPTDLEYVKKVLKNGGFTDYIIRQESW